MQNSNNNKERILDENSPSVIAHLSITQNVIQRMASNSASCKTWCITLVSAVLVIVSEKPESKYANISLLPTVLFFILDTYYLALEKDFRNYYNDFINKLHNDKITSNNIYFIKPSAKLKSFFLKSICSLSIWPFYFGLLAIIFLIKYLF